MCVCVLSVYLQTLVPAVDWMPYLTEVFSPVSLNESEPVVVYAKEYLEQVSDLLTKTNKRSDTFLSLDASYVHTTSNTRDEVLLNSVYFVYNLPRSALQ